MSGTFEFKILKFSQFNPKLKEDHKWIKIEKGLLCNPKVHALRPCGRLLWIHLLTSCKCSSGVSNTSWTRITHDVGARKSVLTDELQKMQDMGMIEVVFQKTHIKRRKEKKREEEIRSTAIKAVDKSDEAVGLNPDALLAIWNSNCGKLPKASRMTTKRLDKVRIRIQENPDTAFWETVVKNLSSSSFVVNGNWAGFDWIIENDTNAVKAFEGKYKDAGSNINPETPYVFKRPVYQEESA